MEVKVNEEDMIITIDNFKDRKEFGKYVKELARVGRKLSGLNW